MWWSQLWLLRICTWGLRGTWTQGLTRICSWVLLWNWPETRPWFGTVPTRSMWQWQLWLLEACSQGLRATWSQGLTRIWSWVLMWNWTWTSPWFGTVPTRTWLRVRLRGTCFRIRSIGTWFGASAQAFFLKKGKNDPLKLDL